MDCDSNVDITELRASDTDTATIVQVWCSVCDDERTVKLRHGGIELALEATVRSHRSTTTVGGGSPSAVTSAEMDEEPDPFSGTDEDTAAAASEANNTSRTPTAEPSTNQSPESQVERDTVSENESVSESTASESEDGFEADEPVETDSYETVLSEINAVRGAGVKNLRDRSETKRVASAVGHEALLEFLQNADEAEYRTAVQEAAESRD